MVRTRLPHRQRHISSGYWAKIYRRHKFYKDWWDQNEPSKETAPGKKMWLKMNQREKDLWKKWKCLENLMNTESDINCRSMKTLEPLLKSHTVTIKTKLNFFKAHVEGIFLYNSELWTTTKTIEDRINYFQQELLS